MAETMDRAVAARVVFGALVEAIDALPPGGRHAAYGLVIERLVEAGRDLLGAYEIVVERIAADRSN